MKRYFVAAAILVSSQITFAATTDLLGLDKLTVGGKPAYSKYVVKDKGGYLTGEPSAIDNGSFEFPVSLSGNFAISAEYEFFGAEQISFISNEYSEIKIIFQNSSDGNASTIDVYIGAEKIPEARDTWLRATSLGYEKFKLSFINGELKIYNMLNELKVTIPLKQQNPVTYTKLVVAGIRETDKLSKLEIVGDTATVGSNGGTTPVTCPTPTGGTTNGTPVTLGANLNMKLPNVSYQTLGGTMNLWAELQYQPTNDGKFWWTLSNYGINP